ncbi:MAG: hypothetical protein D6723_05900 [Acidobacteria bacterium]|nr:MAG: hypothetical protein D6723_05900 [Acidobacteriota bacterium]
MLLQPVSAGDLIDRALRLYRAHLGSFLGLAAVPGLVAVIGGLLALLDRQDASLALLGYAMTYCAAPILNLLLIGGLTRAIADHVMNDAPLSFGRTLKIVLAHFGPLLGVSVMGWLFFPLTLLIIGALSLPLIMVGSALSLALAAGAKATWLSVVAVGAVAAIVLLLGGLLFMEAYGRAAMMPAAAVMEDQPVGSAVSRGLHLGAKTAPKVLAVFAFEYCLTYSIAMALGVPVGLYYASGQMNVTPEAAQTMAMGFNILVQFGSLLSAPVGLISFALLYFDNRVRKEGMDVEILANEIPFPAEIAATPL